MRDGHRQSLASGQTAVRGRRGDNASGFHVNWRATLCAALVAFAAPVAAAAQTLTTLHQFVYTEGAEPNGLVQGTDGSLYGTAFAAGPGGETASGTIFRMSLGGNLTILDSFCLSEGCEVGINPTGALVQGTDGYFYGTTETGGIGGDYPQNGTVFRVSSTGAYVTLHSFCLPNDCADGAYPERGLIQGTDGSFYGTTFGGGSNGAGTVFSITAIGLLRTLYSFCAQGGTSCTDGARANVLVQGTDGNFYGTTNAGGNSSNSGTVFKLTPQGNLTTLHTFCSETNCADGGLSFAGLVQASDGNFYGTTEVGGANETSCTLGCGTVFRITPGGTLTTIYNFCSETDCADGFYPIATLVQGTDGDLYGTADGGAHGYGTLFRITLDGVFTSLYSFCAKRPCHDGISPFTALIQDTNGTFYGTTWEGGDFKTCLGGCGTMFSLSVGLGAFVETRPVSAGVGREVEVLGTNLTSASSVTFNGTPATFTIVSSSLITTTVPAGATTGPVQVVTPRGTLSSNVPFRVIQ